MFENIDHVGIAVADIEEAVALYTRLSGHGPAHREVVERDGVEAVMFQVGGSHIELLGAVRDDAAISGFLAARGGGLHHVAYGVGDVQRALDECAAAGMRLLDHRPRRGAGGRQIAFLHASATFGVLTELCMSARPDGSEAGGTG